MIIDLSKIKNLEGQPLEFSCIYLLNNKTTYDGGEILQESVDVSGKCNLVENALFVKADFSFEYLRACDRCLKPVKVKISCHIDEKFLTEDNGENYYYDGNTLNLAEVINDYILVNVPKKVLCKENCKGLCHTCGQDLNQKLCKCYDNIDMDNNPFAVLKKIK